MEECLKRSDDTKARLIEAGGEVFAERGFRSATVRDICGRAGVPLGAVNYHFRDKQGLYAAVLEHSHQSAVEKYPPDFGLREGAAPEEKLRAFVRSFLLRLLDEGVPAWHMKLMLQEIAYPTGDFAELIESSIGPVYKYLVGVLCEILEEGDPAEGEENEFIFLCAMSVVGQCLHHFTGRRVIAALRPRSFDPDDIERISDHIARFSLDGIRELSKDRPPASGGGMR